MVSQKWDEYIGFYQEKGSCNTRNVTNLIPYQSPRLEHRSIRIRSFLPLSSRLFRPGSALLLNYDLQNPGIEGIFVYPSSQRAPLYQSPQELFQWSDPSSFEGDPSQVLAGIRYAGEIIILFILQEKNRDS
jgi:hypothetical protein